MARSTLPVALAHAKLDLSFNVTGSQLSAEYMAELYDRASIARLVGSWLQTVQNAVAAPTELALESRLLSSEGEREVADFSCGELRTHYILQQPFPQAFRALAAQQPGRPCLCFEDTEMSYKQVAQAAATLAAALAGMGVGKGSTVGVMLERSFELIIAIIGVFQAGGKRRRKKGGPQLPAACYLRPAHLPLRRAHMVSRTVLAVNIGTSLPPPLCPAACYLPCDPSYPDDRLAVYLEDAGATVLLTHHSLTSRADSLAANGCTVLDVASALANQGNAASSGGADGADPAYIIFTSGSTGRPKGVVVPHVAMMDHLQGTCEFFGLGPDDSSLLTITINCECPATGRVPTCGLLCGALLHAACSLQPNVQAQEHAHSPPLQLYLSQPRS